MARSRQTWDVLRRHRRTGLAVVVAGAVVALDARRPKAGDGPSGLEIERKFLVTEPPADLGPGEEIEQGYLAVDGTVEVRLRRRGDRRRTLTVKAGEGEARIEQELEIAEASFSTLWPLTLGRRLRKRRYTLPAGGGLMFDLDVYAGWLSGLVVAEVEFPTLEAAEAYMAPDWLGAEVTNDPSYRNRSLATREKRGRAQREFRLRAGEPVADDLRRVALGQINEVLDRLEGRTGEDLSTVVHESRKSLKRVRAVARLVRDELGDEAFKRENQSFREVGRMLSGPRDSQVLIESLARLAERYPLEMRSIQAADLRADLVSARDMARAELNGDAGPLALARPALRDARERVEGWRLRKRGFSAVRPGLERTYRRGRRAYGTAVVEPTPENLHEWRKRTKDLWYSLQLLEVADPARMKPLARTAHRLSELLGDDHDLMLLFERAGLPSEVFCDTDSSMLLRGLCERRRGELQLAAFGVGSCLYREPSTAFVGRIRRRWRKGVQRS